MLTIAGGILLAVFIIIATPLILGLFFAPIEELPPSLAWIPLSIAGLFAGFLCFIGYLLFPEIIVGIIQSAFILGAIFVALILSEKYSTELKAIGVGAIQILFFILKKYSHVWGGIAVILVSGNIELVKITSGLKQKFLKRESKLSSNFLFYFVFVFWIGVPVSILILSGIYFLSGMPGETIATLWLIPLVILTYWGFINLFAGTEPSSFRQASDFIKNLELKLEGGRTVYGPLIQLVKFLKSV